MAGLFVFQDHLETLKTGTVEQKKKKLTPESIADVKKFIEEERSNRSKGTNNGLEVQFQEWEQLISKYNIDKGTIVAGTADAVSGTPRSVKITLNKDISIFSDSGIISSDSSLSSGKTITLTLPAVDKEIAVNSGNILLTEVTVDDKKLWIQKSDIVDYLKSASFSGAQQPTLSKEISSKQDNGIKEIKEALAEITPENLEKTINFSETFISRLPDGDTKSSLRGIHGAAIFDILRSAGHNLTLQNGQITIVPKPGTDLVNLQEKLQTLVNTKKLSLETLKLGMLYSSPSFKAYSELKKTKDTTTGKEVIDPKANSQDFITYLKDLKKAGNTSGDIETILGSQTMLSGVNMQQAIKGFQDMGQLGEWARRNEQILNQANALAGSMNASNQSSPRTVPSEPNNTLTGKLVKDGITGGHVTGVVGDSTKGLVNGIGDILSLGKGDPLATLGIGAALIYGIYNAFSKFGFLGGLGTLFGIGAMNNIEKIMGRFGVDVGDAAEKARKAAEEAAEKAKATVISATGGTIAPTVGPTNTPMSDIQKDLRKKVEASSIGSDIDKLATAKNPKYPGKLDDYLKFIETDLKDVPLSKLFPSDHKKSIFFDNFDTDFSVDSKLSGKMLKKVLREYLTGSSILTGNGDKLGESEKDNFLKQHNLIPADIANKKLSDILELVHKARTGTTVSASAAPPTVTATMPVPAVSPTTQKNTFKIAGVDKIPGNNVETSVNTPTFDANGNRYVNPNTKLTTYSNGILFAPAGSIVKLGSSVIERQGMEHIEVEYAGEKFYVATIHLKP